LSVSELQHVNTAAENMTLYKKLRYL